jgi:tryptophanyl-tRNA synthetase
VIFSGIQPTGVPHLGNYLGALREWVKLQDESSPQDRCFFSIVDFHAITAPQEPEQLLQWRKEMYASLLAIGLDPRKSTIFCQSHVRRHTELMWILSCRASMGYLSRMTQWKSKAQLSDEASHQHTTSPLGLFSYPVLQAADILLYEYVLHYLMLYVLQLIRLLVPLTCRSEKIRLSISSSLATSPPASTLNTDRFWLSPKHCSVSPP